MTRCADLYLMMWLSFYCFCPSKLLLLNRLLLLVIDLACKRGYHNARGQDVIDLEGKLIRFTNNLPSDALVSIFLISLFLLLDCLIL